ncbi:LysM peptidoglycan-binding domain-containing protein [Altericroceibacterium spongiae]|uniref:LysM peptidoglycan-binding domain-containing protein n=1 Tax=Altericroceibacterium spongiae TaxID=2320269 RepID=A0A420EF79_9SPHN|nr:M48 family metalloprotease [Altericroceibacterium spongiae]RKF19328.1 LysM peptidoglycan-binding domain-containing protein [Altericroceibacterium spongiae]
MHRTLSKKLKSLVVLGLAGTALSGCATMPGSSVPAGSPITQAEAQQGAQYHPQFVSEFGGKVEGPQATYVESVGQKIAVQSGLANSSSAFEVTLLNSSVNNAFAVPGGYVYVTRQLVGLMNNEAELAGVLGHEVGHVAARHSARRQQAAQQNQLLGVLGQVLSSVVLGDSALGRLGQEISSTVPQLATLKYSRGQELQADELGVEYLASAGYDPHAMATVLESLAAQNALDASLKGQESTMPEWASTHPDPASRVSTALQLAGNMTGATNRNQFLNHIDGLMYGDDPKQGVIEGRTFIHPVLRFEFTAPQGFYMVNGTTAVSISGDSGQGQLSTAQFNGNLETYIRNVFSAIGGDQTQLAPQTLQRTTVNGLPAAYGMARANSGQQNVDVTVFAYDFGNGKAFHFATITPAGRSSVFQSMFQSMHRIGAQEAGSVTPRRIDVFTAQRGDTVQTISSRMAFDNAREQRFRVLNGLSANDQLMPGQQYKLVVRQN